MEKIIKLYEMLKAYGIVYFNENEIITKKDFINTIGKYYRYKIVKQAIQEVETNPQRQLEIEILKLKNEIYKLEDKNRRLSNKIQDTIRYKNLEIQAIKNQSNNYIDKLVTHILEKELKLEVPTHFN